MGKLVPRGQDILNQLLDRYPYDAGCISVQCRWELIQLIDSAQMEAYEAGQEETLRIAQQLAARKKITDDKEKEKESKG